MNNSQIIVNPERGEELFMKTDRNFFKKNPNESFYLRERFEDEIMPDSPPYVLVFNLGKGIRIRLPYYKSTVSDEEIKQVKQDYRREFKAMDKLKPKSKPKVRLNKTKGFGLKK